MIAQEFIEKGIVERFPMEAGWFYIKLPDFYSDITQGMGKRGFIPIIAKVGDTSWKTSMLPLGNGRHFIALKADVRKREGINLGDEVEYSFKII